MPKRKKEKKKGDEMSINEKITHIREIVKLVCEVLPQIVALMKEVVLAIKEIQTV